MNTTGPPQQVAVLRMASEYAGPRTPVAISVDGTVIPFDEAPVEIIDSHSLVYDGLPYAFERTLAGQRRTIDGWLFGSIYRLDVGWQALLTADPITGGGGMAPLLKHPAPGREQASRFARRVTTQNLSSYDTRLVCHLVWQTAPGEYSEPVAVLDTRNHSRSAAIKATLAHDSDGYLAWDWQEEEEAGDAPTSPAPKASPETLHPDTITAYRSAQDAAFQRYCRRSQEIEQEREQTYAKLRAAQRRLRETHYTEREAVRAEIDQALAHLRRLTGKEADALRDSTRASRPA